MSAIKDAKDRHPAKTTKPGDGRSGRFMASSSWESELVRGTSPQKRDDGWGKEDWRGWLDRMMPGLPMHLRYPIVSKICKIRTAIFHRLNSGQNLASEAVQRRAQLAELCLRVARGDSPKALAFEANQLIADRESQMVLVAYHVTKNLVNEEIRNQAARAIELAAIRQAQALAPARTQPAGHED